MKKTEKGTPIIDAKQDYTILGGGENATHTTIRFSRDYNTCDSNLNDDFTIEEETIRMIWAYNDNDPEDGGEPQYHDVNRGSKAVVLKGPAEEQFVKTSDIQEWDVLRDHYEIPSDSDTTYLCEIIKLPDNMLQEKHQVVAVSNLKFIKFIHL